jgi:tRNA-dihydrouridine synthase
VQVERMVTGIAAGLAVPLTAKIRIFPELHRTLAYARMLERCGVQLLAVHGRTRDQKDSRAHKADWDAIKVGLSTNKAEGIDWDNESVGRLGRHQGGACRHVRLRA